MVDLSDHHHLWRQAGRGQLPVSGERRGRGCRDPGPEQRATQRPDQRVTPEALGSVSVVSVRRANRAAGGCWLPATWTSRSFRANMRPRTGGIDMDKTFGCFAAESETRIMWPLRSCNLLLASCCYDASEHFFSLTSRSRACCLSTSPSMSD